MIVNNLPSNVISSEKHSSFEELADAIKVNWLSLLILIGLGLLIYMTHQTELLWFCVACFAYLSSASLSRALSSHVGSSSYRDHVSLRLTYRFMLVGLFTIAAYYATAFPNRYEI
jgi:hypothetical protein